MAEIRNYTMNFGSGRSDGLNLKVSLRRNTSLARHVVARNYDLLRPEVHG
jgi:hypothetical protein